MRQVALAIAFALLMLAASPAIAQDMEKERIRRLAYSRWEAANRPVSDGVSFWLEAEREVRSGATAA